jgi:hypothetical protein
MQSVSHGDPAAVYFIESIVDLDFFELIIMLKRLTAIRNKIQDLLPL